MQQGKQGVNGKMRAEQMPSRVPPHDLEAERAVIGALLVSEIAASNVMDRLGADHFYSESHRVIYRAMIALYNRSEPIDQLTLTNELTNEDEYSKVGARPYIFQIVDSVPTAANASRYAEIVRSHAVRRSLIDAGARVTEHGYDEETPVADVMDRAEQAVYKVSDAYSRTGSTSTLGEVTTEVMKDAKAAQENGGRITGMATGFVDLDKLTGGVGEDDLVILAARPAMGKTSLSLDILRNVSAEGEAGVIFSLEMGKKQLGARLMSQQSGISTTNIRNGDLTDRDWKRMEKAQDELAVSPVVIEDDSMATVASMRAKLRRIANRLEAKGQSLGVVVVDYLGLMVSDKAKPESRQQEMADITRSLKILARDIGVPVIALAQLSRAVEQRGDKRPILSDLKDSGAIEADADQVWFVYRDEYYNGEESEERGIAEIIVGKHRNGPTGMAKLAWLENQTHFANLARAERGER